MPSSEQIDSMLSTNRDGVLVVGSPLSQYGPPEAGLSFMERGNPGQRAWTVAPPPWQAIASALADLGLDAAHAGQTNWNPLSGLVRAGGTVVIKPNLVRHFNGNPHAEAAVVVTDWSILLPLIELAFGAVGRPGRVVVADAPNFDCEPEVILRRNQWDRIRDHFVRGGYDLSFADLRQEYCEVHDGVITRRRRLRGDPTGYHVCNVGRHSEFDTDKIDYGRLRGASFDDRETRSHHGPGHHEYLVSATVLEADLLVNVPKFKTHAKIGITGAFKNLVGINGNKNWLPHWRAGFANQGGDQYPVRTVPNLVKYQLTNAFWPLLRHTEFARLFRLLLRPLHSVGARRLAGGGTWIGNDTTWRMVCDLAKVLIYADREGNLGDRPFAGRRVLHVMDAVEAGQGEGPLAPVPARLGFVLASFDALALDLVACRLAGFDHSRIPYLSRALEIRSLPITLARPENVTFRAGDSTIPFLQVEPVVRLAPPAGWAGRVELDAGSLVRA